MPFGLFVKDQTTARSVVVTKRVFDLSFVQIQFGNFLVCDKYKDSEAQW